MPTVSVILPVFNRPGPLAGAMKSVLDQSYEDLELIVVDDASTEDIRSVVEGFADPRVKYVRSEQNGGAGEARNVGIAHASGRYIAFQDSDDLWLPGKLRFQVDLLESLPAEFGCVTGSKILYGRNERRQFGIGKVTCAPAPGRWLSPDEDQLKRALTENRISLQNAIFRRESLPEAPVFDRRARANVDWGFTIQLCRKTRIHEDPGPVVMAFLSTDSVSRQSRKRLLGMLRLYSRNRDLYRRYPQEDSKVLYMIALLLIEMGRVRAGRRVLMKSFRLRPVGSLRYSAHVMRKVLRKGQDFSLARSGRPA